MTTDLGTLRAIARESEARCNSARKRAEEAQAAQHWPGAVPTRARDAAVALERFLVAVEVSERARRALRMAERMEAGAA